MFEEHGWRPDEEEARAYVDRVRHLAPGGSVLESFDYTRHRIHLNHTQIRADADGRFEVCLAHRDPGHPNWLDTAGHNAGYVLARSLLLEDDPELESEIIWEREFRR